LSTTTDPQSLLPTVTDEERVARALFTAISDHDLDAVAALWATGGIESLPGMGEVTAPDGVRAFLSDLFAALPDYRIEPIDVLASGELVAVHFQVAGTFVGRRFQGLEATGGRWGFRGVDLLRITDGRIDRVDVYFDAMEMARGIGALPAAGSFGERFVKRLVNARTRVRRVLHPAAPRPA
jgi:ketosteroid isomerase-like protein